MGAAAVGGPQALASASQQVAATLPTGISALLGAQGINVDTLIQLNNQSGIVSGMFDAVLDCATQLTRAGSALGGKQLAAELEAVIGLSGMDIGEAGIFAVKDLASNEFMLANFMAQHPGMDAATLASWKSHPFFQDSESKVRQVAGLLKQLNISRDDNLPLSQLAKRANDAAMERLQPQLRAAIAKDPKGMTQLLRDHFADWKPQDYLDKLKQILAPTDGEPDAEVQHWLKTLEEGFVTHTKPLPIEVHALEYDPGASTRRFVFSSDGNVSLHDMRRRFSPERLGVKAEDIVWEGTQLAVPMHSTAADILSHLSGSAKRHAVGSAAPATQVGEIGGYWSPDPAVLEAKRSAAKA